MEYIEDVETDFPGLPKMINTLCRFKSLFKMVNNYPKKRLPDDWFSDF